MALSWEPRGVGSGSGTTRSKMEPMSSALAGFMVLLSLSSSLCPTNVGEHHTLACPMSKRQLAGLWRARSPAMELGIQSLVVPSLGKPLLTTLAALWSFPSHFYSSVNG